jgi:fucose 4-O-acetylase-like acetyltransferase
VLADVVTKLPTTSRNVTYFCFLVLVCPFCVFYFSELCNFLSGSSTSRKSFNPFMAFLIMSMEISQFSLLLSTPTNGS